jgi:hypothetical protein
VLQRFLERRHLILAGFWAVLIVPTVLWWRDSVLWVAFLSLYANIASELAAHHALRAHAHADNALDAAEE